MKQQFVDQLSAGKKVEDIFVLAEKTMARKKDGNPYLNVVLTDRTGSLKGVVWDRVEAIAAQVTCGQVVRAFGGLSEYRGTLQLVIQDLQPVSDEAVEATDFLPKVSHDIEDMFARLKTVTDGLETEPLNRLFKILWSDSKLVQRFKYAPAAKKMHHAYIGGLLEHTLSMTLLADKVAGHYKGLNRDLLIAGAVLHDIGKTEELVYRYHIDYSNEGRLLSHIVIGLRIIDALIAQIENFPQNLAVLVKHMVVSHHGSREFGSPEPPKTIEAVVLNYIDEIDSKLNGIREFMAAQNSGEPWTPYHRLLQRHFFLDPPAAPSDPETASSDLP